MIPPIPPQTIEPIMAGDYDNPEKECGTDEGEAPAFDYVQVFGPEDRQVLALRTADEFKVLCFIAVDAIDNISGPEDGDFCSVATTDGDDYIVHSPAAVVAASVFNFEIADLEEETCKLDDQD